MPGIENPLDKKLIFLAFYVMTVIFAYIGAVTFLPVPETGSKYADMAVPFLLGSGFGALIGFYFAGSPANKEKSEIIDRRLGDLFLPPTSTTATSRTVETVDSRKTETVTEPPIKPEEIKP